jgi:hypothetical protein
MSIRTLIAVLIVGATCLLAGSSCGYDTPAYGPPLPDGGFTDGGMPPPMPPYAR